MDGIMNCIPVDEEKMKRMTRIKLFGMDVMVSSEDMIKYEAQFPPE